VIQTRKLTDQEFRACFADPMENLTGKADAVLDIWPYVDALDLDDVGVPYVNDVHYVYRDALNRFDQVVVGTGRFDALLVIVIDLANRAIHGHYLLDLAKDSGVTGGHLKPLP
jgi:hypothetical protein